MLLILRTIGPSLSLWAYNLLTIPILDLLLLSFFFLSGEVAGDCCSQNSSLVEDENVKEIPGSFGLLEPFMNFSRLRKFLLTGLSLGHRALNKEWIGPTDKHIWFKTKQEENENGLNK